MLQEPNVWKPVELESKSKLLVLATLHHVTGGKLGQNLDQAHMTI